MYIKYFLFNTFKAFLLQEELADICFGHLDYMPDIPAGNTPYCNITINNLYAKWNDWETDDTLKDICMSIREKQLFAIVGEPGSGKVVLLVHFIVTQN